MEQKVRAEFAKEGFDILTEINVIDKFEEKPGGYFPVCIIRGVCDPHLAQEASREEISIGKLPCNVVVCREDEGNMEVMVTDPVAALGVSGNTELSEIAVRAWCRIKLTRLSPAKKPE